MKSLLPADWSVPESFHQRLGETVGQQRAMFADGHLLLVLHRPPKPDENQREGRFFWRNPAGEWRANCCGGGGDALARHLQAYHELVDKLDQQEEAATTAVEYFRVINDLTPLVRSSRHFHQVMQDARKLVAEDRDLINLRDRTYDLERKADLLYQDAKNGMEFAVARQSEAQSDASHRMSIAAHRLNVLAAFFFPVATISAVLGVNLRHGYEEHPAPLPFLIALGAGLLCGAILTAFIVRKP